MTDFHIEKSGTSGTLAFAADGTIAAIWFEWRGEDENRVLQAMGKALGFPVMIILQNCAGNGHYSASLRRATPEEAAIQDKIAACPNPDYWRYPRYKRLPEMRAEVGDALLHVFQTDGVFVECWAVDKSKIDKDAFCARWAEQAMQDALEAAHAGKWEEALDTVVISVCDGPKARMADYLALEMISREKKGAKRFITESTAIVYTRSYRAEFAYELQASINRLCGELSLSKLFDVREIVRRYLVDEPERHKYDPELTRLMSMPEEIVG
jgi:hypothetical protein